MSESKEIRQMLRSLTGIDGKEFMEFIGGEIVSVDEKSRTCVVDCVVGESSIRIDPVRLSAEPNDGIIPVPAEGSIVVVAKTQRFGHYLFMTSDLDKWILVIDDKNSFEISSSGIVMNGGDLGGLPITSKTVSRLNNLENKVNLIISAIGAAPIAPTDGGATFKASLVSAIGAPLTPTIDQDIVNNNVKQ